ncbi:hypothetical protein TWF106_011335 [Orbilia oligospora]|uniref:G-patch domain-containing protein n=1 Tax=Orbilia oligospora TaxID=2813651 RepID=A0A6G1M0L3_ORBOL|nr:hypothetical protein TWF679_000854 [Orbilia oligospora]KAF3208849.1 hypothetical protein TWF106_011335 [Orbilia oligospora]KAF3229058.1 hypothetical protein TWF191_001614 [Orbilia oligospora]KAF3240734.1 hypothetical protein TWF192_009409 [Orbilia oligospora]
MASNTGRGMASLYADLLEPKPIKSDQHSTISKSPVLFAPGATPSSSNDIASGSDQLASAKKQVSSAALRFQPIPRRPQPNQQKTVKRAGINTFAKQLKSDAPNDHNLESATTSSTAAVATRAPIVKSTLEDWATNDDDDDDDVNGFYATRQRGGRKRRKKNKDKDLEKAAQSWDDIYDPSRPNQYEEYKDSEEKDQEMRDWRDRLYGRRQAFSSDESDDERARFSMKVFAPPASFGFAPPPNLDQPSEPQPQHEPAPMLDAATGDEVWMMRARMSQAASAPTGTISGVPQDREPTPPPEESGDRPSVSPAIGSSNIHSVTISRAPVIYSLPPAPPDLNQDGDFDPSEAFEDDNEDIPSESAQDSDIPRSNRPGQKGFAERLMSKYGWTKGTGLGATSSGMVHALQVKANKGKDSKGVGKILDKNKKRGDDAGKFGKMSEVVVLHKMVDGLEGEDPAVLMQEIGDECSEKYGRIERVHIIHKQSEDAPSKVFVQFTSQLSALRAVNALEGRMFNGNTIEARFFDVDEFEAWLRT